MAKGLFLLLFFTILEFSEQKSYSKMYYPNGKLQSEGWMNQNQKVDYWFYYYENGNKKEEGHYLTNKKQKWWLFYDSNENLLRKTEFLNDKPNGLTILYKDGKIVKAEKYQMGTKTNEWNSLSAYQKDNIK
ncbi:toxin-antitoxin system YwqK family antitoxin [Flavobacterium sp.]|uniref:toxin-antitoxin system YwqK family antitoxin n=1 Tax=Flavobacterium sp. TaxID=239 RepID=UPI003C4028BD